MDGIIWLAVKLCSRAAVAISVSLFVFGQLRDLQCRAGYVGFVSCPVGVGIAGGPMPNIGWRLESVPHDSFWHEHCEKVLAGETLDRGLVIPAVGCVGVDPPCGIIFLRHWFLLACAGTCSWLVWYAERRRRQTAATEPSAEAPESPNG